MSYDPMTPAGEVAEVEKLKAERDFLLARSGAAGKVSFGGERWTGMSSNALVTIAFGGEDNRLPLDGSDLAACYRTIQRLPAHLLTERVFKQLHRGENHVGAKSLGWARTATAWDEAKELARALSKHNGSR